MEPTLQDNGVFLVDKREIRLRQLKKNDVIIATSPVDRETLVCKRVIYAPGDTFYVERAGQNFTVPSNQYWIEGDNKNNSYDSRAHGPVDKWLIKGVAICKIYPTFSWLTRPGSSK